jgi:hypothetical protein
LLPVLEQKRQLHHDGDSESCRCPPTINCTIWNMISRGDNSPAASAFARKSERKSSRGARRLSSSVFST